MLLAFKRSRWYAPIGGPMKTKNQRRRRIIVIDDDETTLKTISYMLKDEGHEVVVSSNPKEGLEMVLKEPPGLVILDILMPEMDGWEFLSLMRQNSQGQKVPTLVLTVAHSLENMVLAFDRKANGFLPKPVDRYILKKRVAEIMRLSQEDESPSVSRPGGD